VQPDVNDWNGGQTATWNWRKHTNALRLWKVRPATNNASDRATYELLRGAVGRRVGGVWAILPLPVTVVDVVERERLDSRPAVNQPLAPTALHALQLHATHQPLLTVGGPPPTTFTHKLWGIFLVSIKMLTRGHRCRLFKQLNHNNKRLSFSGQRMAMSGTVYTTPVILVLSLLSKELSC